MLYLNFEEKTAVNIPKGVRMAVTLSDGKLIRSVLNSRTFIYRGGADRLRALLEKEYQLNSKEIIK